MSNKPKQESVCKTGHAPSPMLLCHSHCDLDLYPIDLKTSSLYDKCVYEV